jgi:hypothetical protein
MTEHKYKLLIDNYLEKRSSVEEFIATFFNQWRHDRDTEVVYDPKFQRLIDRIFTSCDCYSDNPQRQIEISEMELKRELELLSHIWWG